MNLRKIDLRTNAQAIAISPNAATTELSDAELSSVSGGKASSTLMKSCAKGVHIREATIIC